MSTSSDDLGELSGEYRLDPVHTRLGFVARHAMITKVRGSFNEFDGTAHIDGTDPTQSTAHVVIKAASIDTRNPDRDADLRSNNFFAMEEYPEITFDSTAVEMVDSNTFRVTGDLTIKDVTRPITFELEYGGHATDPYGNARIGLEGSVVINRKDWGITWNAVLETGGVLVGEKVTIELDISAIKAS